MQRHSCPAFKAALSLGMLSWSLIHFEVSAHASQAQPVPIPEDPSTLPQIEIDGVCDTVEGMQIIEFLLC